MNALRSPLSPKALILDDLRRLSPNYGTMIIVFDRRIGTRERIFRGVNELFTRTEPVDETQEEEWGLGPLWHTYFGVLPYDDGTWCDVHCLVWPRDVNSLPPVNRTYKSQCKGHRLR